MESTRIRERRFDPANGRGGMAEEVLELEHVHGRGDLTRWSSIVAGVFVTITALIVLSVLGLAVGLSAAEPAGSTILAPTTGAAIWGIASAAVAFLLGGAVAARTAAVGGPRAGAFNGLMVGVTGIALTVLFVGLGAGNVLGAAAVNLGQVTDLEFGGGDLETMYETAQEAAWGTFAGLSLALVLATLGGLVGCRKQADEGARAA